MDMASQLLYSSQKSSSSSHTSKLLCFKDESAKVLSVTMRSVRRRNFTPVDVDELLETRVMTLKNV